MEVMMDRSAREINMQRKWLEQNQAKLVQIM